MLITVDAETPFLDTLSVNKAVVSYPSFKTSKLPAKTHNWISADFSPKSEGTPGNLF